jgi:bacteriorhodopsin
MENSAFNLLAFVTQYSFWVAFSAMASSAVYFAIERNTLTPKYSAVASLSMMVVFIAAINYFYMKDMVGLDASFATIAEFPTEFRYIDWILTTPLILAVVVCLTDADNKAWLMTKLMIADVIMIFVGFIGEVDINQSGGGTATGWITFLIATAAFVYIIAVLYGEVSRAAADLPEGLSASFSTLKNFLVFSWAIYPVGFMIAMFGIDSMEFLVTRELAYSIADVVSKVGFGMLAVSVAKKLSQYEIRQLKNQSAG